MTFPRYSGILLHPTSLPGRFGIGDLGSEAFKFVDSLSSSGQHLWQILPLGPTGISNSPYNSSSVFAGNPLLIDMAGLVSLGLLKDEDIAMPPQFPEDRVDFGSVHNFKQNMLHRAFENFKASAGAALKQEYDNVCSRQSSWLNTYSLFMALKRKFKFSPWQAWPEEIKWRKPAAIESFRKELAYQIEYFNFEQFLFNRQWSAIKGYCHKKDINIIGDLPIFIDTDSDAVWCNPEMFNLDGDGYPGEVAGVPPDYFSSTGQLWGNPLYRWDAIEQDRFAWWENRVTAALSIVDIIRLDHFRGFDSYWAIPAGSKTAAAGKWMPGPGDKLFLSLEANMGPLPIIAEDLGIITDSVRILRDKLGFPGMRVLQFAFGEDRRNEHRPYNYVPHSVVYTGTHDNDTTAGWFHSKTPPSTMTEKQWEQEKARALLYTGTSGNEIHWDFIRLALASVANTAIIPLQDILGLDSSSRMNTPATASGNWEWRFQNSNALDNAWIRLKEMTAIYGR